ncbi:MAG: phage tail tube protein [Candidatus Nanopelagicales bacterium]|nr:phage tail tube protein [Candidatus Nanopelagicales bacterium]
MASSAISAYGTTLKMGSPLTEIPDITELTPPPLERSMHVVTPHVGGVTEPWEEQIGGIRRGGEISGTQNYKPTRDDVAGGLAFQYATADKTDFQIEYPDGRKWTFKGFVSQYQPSAPVDGPLTASFSITVTESVSFGA